MLVFSEHAERREVTATHTGLDGAEVLFGQRKDGVCVSVREVGTTWQVSTNYYVGAGWLREGEVPVKVRPKMNREGRVLDHLKMLVTCLGNADVAPHVGELYEMDLTAPPVLLPKQDDLLTPMLVAHFLYLVKEVVRQGLRKGYNPVVRELRGRVKGKIEVAKTLRQGVFRGRPLVMACAYEEFSLDIPDNRLLKQALRFAGRYLQAYPALEDDLVPLLRYCEPAFAEVGESEGADLKERPGRNPLYRGYDEALRVGRLLLRRFGFSLLEAGTESNGQVAVPPHWLDMSRLFEMYLLGLLRAQYGARVLYGADQAKGNYGLPDFLLTGETPWVVDAKYKRAYQWQDYLPKDVRQLSGYARDRGVLRRLGFVGDAQDTAVVRCLIVYPQRLDGGPELAELVEVGFPGEDKMSEFVIKQFTRFYKLAVRLPELASQ